MVRKLELTKAWSLLFYQRKVAIFQKTWKFQGHVAKVRKEEAIKRMLGSATAAQKERLNRPVKVNSLPRIGQICKVKTTGRNPREMIVFQPPNLRAVDKAGESSVPTTVVEVVRLIHVAEEGVSEEEVWGLALEAEVS